ncbi:MAG: 1-(5-phosphoribosyl)-5-[(5-phosphoribosylamino)methylideneamino] imidazole-4-carboxamide isomerase [Chitinophagaceae bacterium]|nr:1-(5-phosphoribosyl)-5-[(5-phosphoribosylamino)methylideneamino] imidazole-4-carboxamide isomerase [Chitinophagaceae bacterium]
MIYLLPSITVVGGNAVRLKKGDYSIDTTHTESPLDAARRFEDIGITYLHLVDLDGSKEGKPINMHILKAVKGHTSLKVNYSGGMHKEADILKAFELGAESVTCATIAVYDKELFHNWMMSHGRNKIVLAADTDNNFIKVGGWLKETKIHLFDHIQYYYDRGLKFLKTTDINRDGLFDGPNFVLYKSILEKFPDICLIASGGIRNIDDIKKLQDLGVYGIIFNRAYYEGKITLKELENFITHNKKRE